MNAQPVVLVIDHLQENRHVIGSMLSEEGFSVIEATNGEAGIALVIERKPSLIILEVMMPNFNGFQTCKALKAHGETCYIPIVFISILDDVENKVKGLSIGGADYIPKPFEKDEVLARARIQIKMREAFELLIEKQAQKLKELADAQRAILVKPEDDPKANFDVLYLPLKEIGGDYYEVFSYGDCTSYFIGDISGHDIHTGYITAALNSLLKQNAGALRTPLETIDIVNSLLIKSVFKDGQFMTGQYIL